MRERERLIGRIRQLRRVAKTRDEAAKPPAVAREQDGVRLLELRIEHLESVVQGLQDSVHRESSRHARL